MAALLRTLFSQSSRAANLTIVLLLSIGLSAATALFTALDRFLLNPLPFAGAARFVRCIERNPPALNTDWFPFRVFQAMQSMHSLDASAVEANLDLSLSIHGEVRPVLAQMVSGHYFSMLGQHAALGRALDEADDETTSGVPVVLGNAFWKRAFAGSSAVLGSVLTIQGRSFVIVGVMPQSFFGTRLDLAPDLWIPLSAQPLLSTKSLSDPESDRHFAITGRLREGVTLTQAESEFAALYRTMAREGYGSPDARGSLVPLTQTAFAMRDSFHRVLALLGWALLALLLVMSANVGGMLIARALRRERETAVRLALGATRARLILASLRESLALGLAGSIGGIALAACLTPLLSRLLPFHPADSVIQMLPDGRAVLFSIALALALSLVFGSLPAFFVSRTDPQESLRRGASTRRSGSLGRFVLGLQTALTLVLLVGTALMLRTFFILRHTNPGFDVEHLVTFALPSTMDQAGTHAPTSLREDLLERVRRLPAVRSASLADAGLMLRVGMKTTVALPGQRISSSSFLNTSTNNVSSSFFATMSMPIVRGAAFEGSSAEITTPEPVVVNQAFARLLFPGIDPIGRTFGSGAPGDISRGEYRIAGIVADSKYRSLREPLLPIYYKALRARAAFGTEYLYVRSAGPPEAIIAAVRSTLRSLDATRPFVNVVTMQQQIVDSLWQERLTAVLASIFAMVSILMAAMGLYGMLAYDAVQRTREFGIRLAVGAQRASIAHCLLRDLLHSVLPGLLAGRLLCLLFGRILTASLYGVKATDALSLTGSVTVIALVALGAAGIPMRRAMCIDLASTLREE